MPPPPPDVPRETGFGLLAPLLSAYRPPAGHWDELQDEDGRLRPGWERFARAAGDLGSDALAHAARRIARQIHENGVTYNVYAADHEPGRPWSLDVLPALIAAHEWGALEASLRQYARLMNALSADIYGDQTLVREGLLPPAVVFRHPGFLRACHGVRPLHDIFLHVVALDLVHGPDGTWRLIGTRAQAPSGLGYVLENRSTIARLFPDAMRALGARSLAPFYDALLATFVAAAPQEDGPPRIVLLTPGPFNEAYFEHVYLARELGLPLVQGGDLLVRHDRVFLKTVAGLRRVHGIWRRQNDDYCDPLELRADSILGVSGLVQAWRAGHVLVANGFGTSVLESAALLPFLPDVCQRLLGEPLHLPLVPTWWCGEQDRADLPQDKTDLDIAPAFPDVVPWPALETSDSWAGGPRPGQPDTRLEEFVAQRPVSPSHGPVWRDGSIQSRAMMLRVFLVADLRGDYTVMPGGLSRMAADGRAVAPSQRGGHTKDTWVLPVEAGAAGLAVDLDLRPRREVPHSERATSSRSAENLFWLGRYAERSENNARLLRAVLGRLSQIRTHSPTFGSCLFHACKSQGLLRADELPDRASDMGEEVMAAVEHALLAGLSDNNARQGLAFNIARTWRAAGAVRERLSSDNWRVLNRLFRTVASRASTPAAPQEGLELLDDAVVSLVAVGGLETAHMTRDDGWRFLSLGRHLERLSFVAETLEGITLHRAMHEPAVLEWLLDLSDSLITYRARHFGPPEWPAVLDLLFFDEQNPRSAMFQVAKVAKHAGALPGPEPLDVTGEIDALHSAGRVSADRQHEMFGGAVALDYLPRACRRIAERVSDAVTLRYFSHAYDAPRAIVAT